jgi:aminoglycoside phosphotransferase (APT) family kinase protein
MTGYDLLAEADADDECRAWVRNLINAKQDVVAFVDSRLGGQGRGEYLGFFKGSFNVCFHIGFGDRQHSALIRFAKPGHTLSAWRDEKVLNEVRVIEYLRDHTTIPVPNIRSWGLSDGSPAQLGPFIIMDFIEGVRLSRLLREDPEDDQAELILDPAIPSATLDTIYDQLASYLLQLSRLTFPSVGAISKDPTTQTWSVANRPLTFNMNELATNAGFPFSHLPTSPFPTATSFLESLTETHLHHLQSQRNICPDEQSVRRRFIARHRLKQLIPSYVTQDDGQFPLFSDDLQPTNILIDPFTLQITGIIDWEFTNAMPAQFTHDPPWWLLLRGPDMWVERFGLDQFLERYVPRMEQFLRAMERAEAREAEDRHEEFVGDGITRREQPEERLSAKMRASWETGQFWFDYAARTSLDVDDIYWSALHDHGREGGGEGVVEAVGRGNLEALAKVKMEQFKEYEEEGAVRFRLDDEEN